MNRQALLLGALAVVLVVALWWFFLIAPMRTEVEELEAQIEQTIVQQSTVRQRIAALEELRAAAPAIEAEIVAAEAVVPRTAALPSAVRQLAQAADDSGIELLAVVPGRPTAVAGGAEGLAELSLALTVEGSYFQYVDFLRRIEDPAIIARGIVWDAMTLSTDEYPVLGGTLTGRMFAVLPAPPAAPTDEPTDEPTEPVDPDDVPIEPGEEVTP